MPIKQSELIKCPVCKAEYLPAEIFYPKQLLGEPKYIDKTETGKVEAFLGNSVNGEETYVCDYCGNSFCISAYFKFVTYENKKNNAKAEYATKIKPNITLKET